MYKFGLKLWSTNTDCLDKASRLCGEGVFDYVELYVVPKSAESCLDKWKSLHVPYVLHAPHSYSGLNLSLCDLERNSRCLIEEVELFRGALNPTRIIFHPGINGVIDESIRQILLFKEIFPSLFDKALIENKPKMGLKNEICVGASPAEIREMMAKTMLGFCLDVGHAISYSAWAKSDCDKVLNDFLELDPYMIHLSDGRKNSCTDSHLNFGCGDFDIKRIVEKIPSNKLITIETSRKNISDLDPLKNEVIYLKGLFNGLHQCVSKQCDIESGEIGFRDLEDSDIHDLFEWRNHPDVRKNYFDMGVVSWEEHESWFNAKIRDTNTAIYIAYLEKQKLGSIRFESRNGCVGVSVMLNPDFLGMGLGSEVIRMGTARFIKKNESKIPIIAEVKTDNIASLKSFLKAGFILDDVDYINSFKSVRMVWRMDG